MMPSPGGSARQIARRAAGAVVLVLLAGTAGAQTTIEFTEDLEFDRPESWADKYFTSVAMLSPFGVPREVKFGRIELGIEGGTVPTLSREEMTVGFEGTKLEDLNRTKISGRIRVLFGLPAKLSLTVGWTPPVEVDGATPNLVSLSIGRPLLQGDRYRIGLRLHGQAGRIDGDFTCTRAEAAAGIDIELNPFGCEAPSRDRLTTRYAGLEFGAAFPLGEGKLEPYLAGSVNYMDLEFQVNARYGGIIDHTLQRTDGTTWSVVVGANYRLSNRWALTGELFHSRLDVVRPPSTTARHDDLLNFRAMLAWRVR